MERIYLIKPTVDLKEEYIDFHLEWKNSGEDIVPWVVSRDPSNFEEMVEWLNRNELGIHLIEGWVPDTTRWLITENKRVLGAVNIRHTLTEFLLNRGGHIGYGIRPSERRKGYATKMLALALEEARTLELNRVLVVCDKDNIASERTIIRNGGIPDTDFVEENGNIIKRYWIDL